MDFLRKSIGKKGEVINMPYYYTCPHCGANLDPGERCDCISYGLDPDISHRIGNRCNNQSIHEKNTNTIIFLTTERSNYGKRKQA